MAGKSLELRTDRSSQRGQFLRPRGRSRDNALIVLAYVLSGAAAGFYQHVMPLYIESLGARPDQVGLTLAIGGSGAVVAILAGGLIADRFSYRKQIVVGWLLSVVGIGIYGLAQTWQMVAVGLLLTSGTNFVIPALSSYVTAIAKRQDPNVVFANIFAASAFGALITPAIGGLIIASSGIRAVFVASFVFAIGSALAISLLREQPSAPRAAEPALAPPGAAGRVTRPLGSYGAALRHRPFRGLLVTLIGLYLATATGVALLPNYLHDRAGLDPSTVGTLGSGAAAVTIVGSLALGRRSMRLGVCRSLAVAQALLVTGYGLVLLAPSSGALALVVGGLGFALRGAMQVQASLSRGAVTFTLDRASAGSGYALQSALFALAQVVGPVLAGQLYTREPSLPLLVALGAGLALVLRLLLMSDPTRPARARADAWVGRHDQGP